MTIPYFLDIYIVIIHNLSITIRYHHCTMFSPQYFFVRAWMSEVLSFCEIQYKHKSFLFFFFFLKKCLNCTLWFIACLRLDEKNVQQHTVCLIAFRVCWRWVWTCLCYLTHHGFVCVMSILNLIVLSFLHHFSLCFFFIGFLLGVIVKCNVFHV